jgi:uncharacterized protein YkwD
MQMREMRSLLMLLLLVAAGPATRPATQPRENWVAMTADRFARTDAANCELPWEDLDDELLCAAILHETNQFRIQNKLPALKHMPAVDAAPIMHAEAMAEGHWFSHVNEGDPKKREVIDRVKLLGLNPMFVGENIIMEYGMRYQPKRRAYDIRRNGEPWLSYEPNGEPIPPHTYLSFAKQVTRRWMDSPAHRENMLSKHAKFLSSAARPGNTEDELRFHKYYAVQVFFTPMPGR